MNSEEFKWRWEDFCPTGLNISDENSTIAPCFQQICLQLPVFVLLAVFSSYYYGKINSEIQRDQTQKNLIGFRAFIVFLLAIAPPLRLCYMMAYEIDAWPIDIMLTCVQFLAWTVHLCILISYRKAGTLSHRGPLMLCVLWSAIFSLSIIWLQTSWTYELWPWSLATLILKSFYGFTLLKNGKSQLILRERIEDREALINSYHHFQSIPSEEILVLGAAQDGYNCLSKLIFYWVNPLIDKGVLGKLRRNDDLFDLPECLNIKRISERLQKHLDGSKSLFKALHRSFGVEFYLIGLLRLVSDLSSFAGPLLLGGLLQASTDESKVIVSAYWYAAGLFSATLISALCGVHFNWRMSIVSTKMRTSLVSAIYRKGLEAKGLHDAKPEILNLMSTDTDRIVNSCASFHSLWSIPFQLFTTLYLLYVQLGVAFLSGVFFAICLIPINRYIAQKIGKLSSFLMTAKDARVSVTTESLTGAKQVKLQAWENIWIQKISDLRAKEIFFLSKRKYLDAWCVYFWATTPVLMCLLTFGGVVLLGQKLTPATTYTSVALLNLLIGPLNAFPWVLNGLMEAWVSLKRVQQLVDIEDIDLSSYYTPTEVIATKKSNDMPLVLSINDGDFAFDQKRNRSDDNLNVAEINDFKMKRVNLEVRRGELVCIDGPVGSGKTSLLNALLGNLKRSRGSVSIKDFNSGFGYVSQNPWLQRGTVRENICWGSIFDESKYEAIVDCCALRDDIEKLGGDTVGVGEGGRTLSGGQRVRVTLARALYQEKPIYVFDDIFSALDAHVASYIIKHCIFGMLAKKTRIIVTQNKTLLDNANQIVHVENGLVSCIDLMNDESDLSDDDEVHFMTSSRRELNDADLEDRKSIDSCLMEEPREFGNVSTSVIGCYWNAMSGPLGFFILLSVLLMQVSRNVTDGWLAHWVSVGAEVNSTTKFKNRTDYYLEVYAGFAVINSFLTLVRSFIFAYGGIRAAKAIHKKLLKSVFYTKLQFFDTTPLGRILNRFSSDTYTIDDSLPFILNILLAQLFGLIGSISISLYALPWLTIVITPLCPIYLDLQSRYRNASRDIKRLASNSLSPLYAHFTETLQGLTTIRAMRAGKRFRREFANKLEDSIRAQITAASATSWLSIRLQLLGAVLVGSAGVLTAITSAHTSTPGMVGLAISYALSISGLLGGVLNAFSETEQEMIAVERVSQYLKLEPETNAKGFSDPPFGWPFQGVIQFQNVHMSYRENLVPALNGISFSTSSYERLGLVGRTGAGKSSIIAALLRVSPQIRGSIIIDNVNISSLPLHILRSRIAIVPQEPFLFSGSVRDNLDPQNLYLDSEIWNAISNCLTSPLVQSLGGIYGRIDTAGANLSSGQKQLLCLTRALLKSAKVVLIDEGTANLDNDSELAIQVVLKNAFRTSTVLIIAHRLNGLQNTDKIIVVDNGEIVETGTPKELSTDPTTYLFRMLQEQNNSQFH